MIDFCRLANSLNPAAILDVGAHTGETVLEVRKRVLDLPVFCFEPTPAVLPELSRVTAGLRATTIVPVALSDRTGTQRFHCNVNEQTNSLLESDVAPETGLGNLMKEVGAIDVPTVRLDDWLAEAPILGRIFLKMDVQGAEGIVLRGAKLALLNRVDVVLAEASIAPLYRGQADLFELQRILADEADFEVFQIYRTRSDGYGRALWLDAMWVRRGLLESNSVDGRGKK